MLLAFRRRHGRDSAVPSSGEEGVLLDCLPWRGVVCFLTRIQTAGHVESVAALLSFFVPELGF